MIPLTPNSSHSLIRVLITSFLTFALLTTPLASSASLAYAASAAPAKHDAKESGKASSNEALENSLFVKQPTAVAQAPAPAAPVSAAPATEAQALPASHWLSPLLPEASAAPQPLLLPPGSFTVTMAAALTATANNNSGPDAGKADPGDTITYTVTLDNQTGSDATALGFSVPIDSHTTLTAGTLNSTPVAFDQAFPAFNEDSPAQTITLQGQDPDGSNISSFSIVASPTKGTLGSIGSISCAGNGVCSASVSYTPNANANGSDSFTFRVNDGTVNSNQTATVSITINAINDPPTFTQSGGNQTVNEDAGAQSVSGFITSISPGPADEVSAGQTVSFVTSNNNNSLFLTQPAIDSSGKLTYTPAANANGTATVSYHAQDSGSGTAPNVNISSPDQTFTITVNAVNDAPIAQNKSFTAQANMKIQGVTGLLTGATDPDKTNGDLAYTSFDDGYTPTFTITAGSIMPGTVDAGDVACTNATISNVNTSTGTFDFDPPPGFTGNCTLVYKITDSGFPSPGVSSANAKITVTINGPVIWFVNPAAGPATGDGRLSNPFSTLAQANTAKDIAQNQRIFVYGNGTATTSGTTVSLSGAGTQSAAQWLIGQGAIDGVGFDNLMGISPPAGTIARPSVNGTRPTIQGTVTMGQNTVVRGLNISTTGSAKGITASGVSSPSTINVSDVNVTTASGNAVDFNNAQTVNYTSSSASSTNTIVSTSGIGVNVIGGTTIGANGMTFKSVSVNGAPSGIVLNGTGNTGTFNVTGDGTTTGGVLNRNASGGTMQNTTDDCVRLTNTNNVTLKQIDFTKCGDNATGLASDNESTSGEHAVEASGGSNVILSAITVTNPATTGVVAIELSGTSRINQGSLFTSINNQSTHAVYFKNTTVSNTLFEINDVDFKDSSSAASTVFATNGPGSANMEFDIVNGCLFQNLNNQAVTITPGADVGSYTGTFTSNVKNSTFKDAMVVGGFPAENNIGILVANHALHVANVESNTFDNIAEDGTIANTSIIRTQNSGGRMTATIKNNTIQNINYTTGGRHVVGHVFEPAVSYNASDFSNITIDGNTASNVTYTSTNREFIFVDYRANASNGNVTIKNNNWDMRSAGAQQAIELRFRETNASTINVLVNNNGNGSGAIHNTTGNYLDIDSEAAATVNTTVTNNNFQNKDSGNVATTATSGIDFETEAAGSSMCVNVSGNTVPAATNRIRLAETLGNMTVTQASAAAVQSANGGAAAVVSGTPTFGQPACSTPTALFRVDNALREYLAQADKAPQSNSTDSLLALLNINQDFAIALKASASALETSDTQLLKDTASFAHKSAMLGMAVNESISAHAEPLASATTEDSFWTAHASQSEAVTTAQANASNQSADNRALDYSAHNEKASLQPMAEVASTAKASTVSTADASSGSVSNEEVSLSHAPSKRAAEVNNAPASALAFFAPPTPPGSFPVNGTGSGFKLPTGKTVTITFQVTVNNPPNLTGVTPPKVSFQGTLQGSVGTVLSDDPNTGTAGDATVTLVDLFNTTSTITGASPSNSTSTGQSVTFTASIVATGSPAPAGGTLPSGTATFKDNGSDISGCVNVTVTSGSAQCTTSALTTGTHNNITVVYSGDGNFDASTSAAFTQTVTQSGTTVTVVSSLNPSLVTQNVTFTATVASTGGNAGPPTGTVTFKDGVNPITCSNAGGQTLSSGVATCQTATLPAGSHSITAVYGGDTNFTGNTGTLSAAAGQNGDPQVVNKSNTTLTLGTSGSPTTPGTSVTFTATISSATVVTAARTGTVTFYDGSATPGNEITACGASGVVTVSSNQAVCTTNALSEATHTITAVYSGDATYNGSNNTVQQVVAKNATSTNLVSSKNPSAPTEAVTFTATVSSSAGTPTGTVTFQDNNVDIAGCVNVALSSGQAQCLVPANTFSVATHPITAVYAGTATFSGSTSNTVNQLVTACTNSVVVTNTNDSGTGSLRDAITTGVCSGGTITFSNSTAGGATNFFDGNTHTITLAQASGPLAIANDMTIQGPGANVLTVSGNDQIRVFTVASGKTVSISGMTITKGKAPDGTAGSAGGDGGAITNSGTLTLTGVVVSNSNAGAGGNGGGSPGGNGGNGGGIYSTGTLYLINSTVSGNQTGAGGTGSPAGSGGSGGGIYSSGSLGINGSTISGNKALGTSGAGGGIASASGTLTLFNSTIYGNTANGEGGGILNSGTSTASLANVTVTANRSDNDNDGSGAGGGIRQTSSNNLTLFNTIVSGNFKGMGGAVFQVETATVVVPTTITAGSQQVETVTVLGAVTADGNAKVTVTAAGMTGSPKTIPVAVLNGDDASAVAGKIRTALTMDTDVSALFNVSGTGANVVLTANAARAHDATLHILVDNDTSTGLTTANSTSTTPGTYATVTVTASGMNNSPKTLNVPVSVGDDASAVAGKMRTALSNDGDVSAFFTVSGSTDQIVLTAKTAAADDATMNIATADGTSVGLTAQPTSANTTAGFAGSTASDISGGVNTGSSSFNLIGTGGAGGLTNATNNNQVGVDPLFNIAGLTNNGGSTQTVGLQATSPAIDTGNSTSAGLTTLSTGIDGVTTTVAVTDANMIPVGVGYTILVDSEQMVITDKSSNTLTVTRGANGTTAAAHSGGAGVYPAIDQRGFPRPVNFDGNAPSAGNDSDIGAYEQQLQPAAPNAPDLDAASDTGASNTDNITSDTSPTFTISGVNSGATVKLYRDDDGAGGNPPAVVATGTAASTSIQLTDPSAPGSATPYIYTATQTLGGAPESAQSASLSVTIDSSTPGTPGTPDLQDASDSGISNTDNITNVTPRVFDITNTDNGTTVELLRDTVPTSGSPVVVATGTGNGGTLPLTDNTAASDGTYVYTSRQTNGVGASTSSAGSLNVVIDTIAPPAPSTPDLQAASDSGNNSDNITNASSRAFDIAGTTSGVRVELYRGTDFVGFTTGNGGTVTITDVASVADNTYNYSARQVDVAGNFASSGNLAVTLDTVSTASAPDLQAGSDSGVSNTDDITNAASLAFDIASTENGATVELYRDANLVTSTTGTGGTVTLTDSTALADNTYAYTVKQTDLAGNVGTSPALNVKVDKTAPVAATPDLNAASDTGASSTDNRTSAATPHVFNVAINETGSKVELLRNGTPVTGAFTTGSGTVQLSDPDALADGMYQYAVRETDVAGNVDVSASPLDVVIDTTAPGVASVTRANPSPTAAASVNFTVTFSEPVQVAGVDATDFQVTTTGGISLPGSPITAVTPVAPGGTPTAATQFTVTVDTGTGDGTIRLDVLGDGSIKDLMDLAFNGPTFTSGEVYSVVKSNPAVVSINTANANPTNLGSVDFTVTFNKPVTGVDTGDFQLVTSGVAAAGISGVTGSSATYTVTVNTGTGDGTIGLNLVDDDSITDGSSKPLGGTGANNGNFTGQVYTVDKTVPTVTSVVKAVGQADPATGPTSSTVINFTVTFSEAVTGFDSTDIIITGTSGATVANVTGSGDTYNVGVEGMTQSGSVTIQVPANAAFDAAGNTNAASATATVQYIKDNFTTFEVNTVADTDDGSCDPLGTGTGNKDCTLREAINLANNDGGSETITFNSTVFAVPGPYTINLGGALPDITSDMTIAGPGAKVLTVKRNTGGNYRIFTITDGSVTIDGLTISNGNATGGGPSDNGGGIFINTLGTITISNTAISGNSATVSGGGIFGGGSTLNIINSTISGNTALQGGGVELHAPSGNITNSTISGNSATVNGGGILAGSVGTTGTITDSTITNNRADSDNSGTGTGGGIFKLGSGTVILRGSIVAANYNDASPSTTPDDIGGAMDASSSFNLIGTGGSGGLVNGTNSNQVGVPDPGLNPLAFNGGQTQTHALQCTSLAIDAGKAFGQTADQRGLLRTFDLSDTVFPNAVGGDGTDIGSYESQSGGGCIPVAVPTTASTNEDTQSGIITLTGTFSQNFPLSFTITTNPSHGTLTPLSGPVCNFDGGTSTNTCTSTLQYTPASNFNGTDVFSFKVTADLGGGKTLDSLTADVNVTVNAVNDPPTASSQIVNTDEDTPVGITLSGSDPEGASLSYIVNNPAHGSLSGTAPNLTYTPNANYNGADSFTFKVNDGAQDSNVATVTINIHSIADTPSVSPATTTINKQTSSGLVISRNAGDGSEVGTFFISNIQNGTLYRNDGTTQINNGDAITFAVGNAGLKFTPNHNLTSPSTTFSFDVQAANNGAGDGISGAVTASITVNCSASTVVTNTNDSGAGSLRDAIFNACPDGTITFNIPTSDPGYNATTGVTTVTLTSAELFVDRNVTITGPGADKLTVARSSAGGTPDFRIFHVTSPSVFTPASLDISGLTILNGRIGGNGGGILNESGSLSLTSVVVTGNFATGSGGGVSNAAGHGAAIIKSTIAGNTSPTGGGIANDGSLTLVNSTISTNNADGLSNSGGVSMTNSTFSGNQVRGITNNGGTVTIGNTIVANTPNGNPDVSGTFNTTGNNLIGNASGATGFTNGVKFDKVGATGAVIDPLLLPLANNGGTTPTHLPLPGSPAVDFGSNTLSSGLTTDQRGPGFQRIVNGSTDIGAVEVSYENTATAGTPQSATINSAFATQLKATIKEHGNLKANIPVTFTAPSSGASGTFAGSGTSVTVNTDANGVATAPVFTANGIAGPYIVVASLGTGQPTSNFSLSNNTAVTSTTLTSSVNPSDFGETVTFTATVSSSAGTPTGTVTFSIDGGVVGSPVTLAGGVATFSTSTLSVGNHPVSVSYAGDGNYQVSTASLAGGQQVVKPVPTLSINDVTLQEGNSGTTNFVFTVTLSAKSNLTVKVNYATADGTAKTSDNDYQPQSGTLTFAPQTTTQTITVPVNGDTKAEANETFFVNLSNSVNADISDNQGLGTILSEDTPIVEFSAASYTVAESGLHATITVNRLGDLSKAASVDYATSDPSGLNNCSQVTGNASQRCDYATVVGTLRFAANESSKTIFIPIVNDVYVEGPEFFTITLSNLQGVEFGAVSSAKVNITDDDNGGAINPITDDAFFIRQLYIDFLGREPEPAGLQGWLDVLHRVNPNQCKLPTDCDRIAVALGFVQSPEFQARGYFTFRFYTTALGRNPSYAEFIPDMARLSGFLNPAEVEQNKTDFVNQFMSRQEFKNLYDPTIGDPTSYVDKLLATVGLPNHPLRNTWITGLSNNSLTRAQVLRQLVESTEVYTKFYNQAIIVMNYFGFLRRDPDAAYQTWIDIFNHTNDYRIITNGFINSPEYPQRFGP